MSYNFCDLYSYKSHDGEHQSTISISWFNHVVKKMDCVINIAFS